MILNCCSIAKKVVQALGFPLEEEMAVQYNTGNTI